MAAAVTKPSKVAQTLSQLGHCLELIPVDPHCFDISVGLYEKDGILTIWSFNKRPEVHLRLSQIRDQLVKLGGLTPLPRVTNKVNFPCGYIHVRPLKFLMMQAVESPPDYVLPMEPIKDLRSDLTLSIAPKEKDGRWMYEITAEGEHDNKDGRIRMIGSGFVRYGEMEKVDDLRVAFVCGERHDKLAWLLLAYARNVSGVEEMLEAAAMRGQMTTGTLGFSQT